MPHAAAIIMATCNTLFYNNGKVVGDPLEVEALKKSGFSSSLTKQPDEKVSSMNLGVVSNPTRSLQAQVVHMYPFSSSLKRMSVIAGVKRGNDIAGGALKPDRLMVFTKGAPEVIAGHLKEVPAYYHQCYQVRRPGIHTQGGSLLSSPVDLYAN